MKDRRNAGSPPASEVSRTQVRGARPRLRAFDRPIAYAVTPLGWEAPTGEQRARAGEGRRLAGELVEQLEAQEPREGSTWVARRSATRADGRGNGR